MLIRRFSILLLCSLLCTPVSATRDVSEDIEARLDAHLQPFADNRDFSGVILVARGEEILYRKAFGMADYERGVLSQPTTKYLIASLTKTFTSAAILSLAKEGRIDLHQTIDAWLPDFSHGGSIQVRHLLMHMSGLADFHTLGLGDALTQKRWSLDELLELTGAAPLEYEPGTDGAYNNAGYVVLARIIEKAGGMPYEQFLKKRFFGPLGMENTGIWFREEILPGRALPFKPGPPPHHLLNLPLADVSFAVGSGALTSTVDDLHRWGLAVAEGELFDLLAQEYPFGWGREERNGQVFVEQTGLLNGYMSMLQVYPEERTVIVMLGNIISSGFFRLQSDLPALVFGESVEPYQPPEAVRLSAEHLSGLVGRYLDEENNGFDISLNDGYLYSTYIGSDDPRFVTPMGAYTGFVRADNMKIEFERSEDGKVVGFWRRSSWGDGWYERQ